MMTSYDLVLLSHHKCATNWLRGICEGLVDTDLISVDVVGGKAGPVNSVSIDAKRVLLNVNASGVAEQYLLSDISRNIHFVRDPRDALVSNYFSWRYSHKVTNSTLADFRERSSNLSIEQGMMELVEVFPMGKQLAGWTDDMWGAVMQVRYEDLLDNFYGTFRSIFGTIGPDWSDEMIRSIQEKTSFSRMSGREDGSEDEKSHFRRGKSGDWETYFTDRLSKVFFEEYGWMGERLGYW